MSFDIGSLARKGARLGVITALALLAFGPPAYAAFPGANGKLAFSSGGGGQSQIYLINPDGTGRVQLTQGPGRKFDSAWSPDGQKIAFVSNRDDPNPSGCSACNYEIYVMDADGMNLTRLTNDPELDEDPAWSPDGTKILFTSHRTGGLEIYKMNADGSGVTRLTFSGTANTPAWSPDGAKIAFSDIDPDTGEREIEVADPNISSRVDLTNDPYAPEEAPDWSPDGQMLTLTSDPCGYDTECISYFGGRMEADTIHADGTQLSTLYFPADGPVWSPDGSRVAVGHENCTYPGHAQCLSGDLVTMNPDGSARTNLTNNPDGAYSGSPSWQPIPINAYPRPKGATPMRASLVPAYKRCTAPNTSHGSPLAYGSCKPPSQASSYLTVGTPDANGQAAHAAGYVLMRAFSCPACAGPGPNADVRLDVSITDVRKKSDLSDYNGALQADAALRITDQNNTPNPGGPGAATVSDTHFPFTVPCATTADASVGSTCSVSTSANTVVPGAVVTAQRAIWELGQVQVYDGGADGSAATTADNTLFMDEGIFVP
jgi:dipeptidyl aminopeptidase/acylaminoacyl peptidase